MAPSSMPGACLDVVVTFFWLIRVIDYLIKIIKIIKI
jgi:hypothetical protein